MKFVFGAAHEVSEVNVVERPKALDPSEQPLTGMRGSEICGPSVLGD